MSRMSGSVRSRYFIDRIRFGVEKPYFWFFGFRETLKSTPPSTSPPGGGRVDGGVDFTPLRKTKKPKIRFFFSKSYSIIELSSIIHLRHPRHDQNMLETCFGPFKYDFRMVFENIFSSFLKNREGFWPEGGVDSPPPRGGKG